MHQGSSRIYSYAGVRTNWIIYKFLDLRVRNLSIVSVPIDTLKRHKFKEYNYLGSPIS